MAYLLSPARNTSWDVSDVVHTFFRVHPAAELSTRVSSPLSSAADKSPVYSGNSYYSLNSWLCILHYWISSYFYYSSLQGHPVLSVWHASQVCVISRLQPHATFCAKVIHENIKWDPSSKRILEELRSYTQPDTSSFNTTSCYHSVSSSSILTVLVLQFMWWTCKCQLAHRCGAHSP